MSHLFQIARDGNLLILDCRLDQFTLVQERKCCLALAREDGGPPRRSFVPICNCRLLKLEVTCRLYRYSVQIKLIRLAFIRILVKYTNNALAF